MFVIKPSVENKRPAYGCGEMIFHRLIADKNNMTTEPQMDFRRLRCNQISPDSAQKKRMQIEQKLTGRVGLAPR